MLPSFSDILLDDDVLGNECLVEDEELGQVLLVNDDGLLLNKDQLAGGQWVTIGGAHVYIKGGKIAAGPAVFKGKTLKQATAHATKVKKDVASAAKKVDKTGSKVEKAKAAIEKARTELKKHSGGLATVRKQIKQTKVKSTAAQAAVSKAQKGKVTASTDIHDHIRKTNELTRKSVAGTLRTDEVEAHIKSLNKLNKDQVLRLAEATNISGSKTKKAALEAIGNKLQGQGGSLQSSLGGSKTQSAAQTITGKEQHGKAIGKALDDAMGRIKAGGDHKAETAEVHRQVDDAFNGVRLKAHAEAIARGFGIIPKGTIDQTKDAIKAHATARVGGYLRSQLVNRPVATGSTAGSSSTTGSGGTTSHGFTSRTPDEHHAVYEDLMRQGLAGKQGRDATGLPTWIPTLSRQEFASKVESFGEHLDKSANKDQVNQVLGHIGVAPRSKKSGIELIKTLLKSNRGAFMRGRG